MIAPSGKKCRYCGNGLGCTSFVGSYCSAGCCAMHGRLDNASAKEWKEGYEAGQALETPTPSTDSYDAGYYCGLQDRMKGRKRSLT